MRKKEQFFIFFMSFVLVVSIVLISCRCPGENESPKSKIPTTVLRKADQFIKARTGDAFFEKYITIDYLQTIKIEPGYLMVYRFYMPEKPFVDELIRFTADTSGDVLTQFEVVGIPECNSNPGDCDFIVDEVIAYQIANQNNLAKGINNWKGDFVWSTKHNKYVWEIISTTKESKDGENYRAEGEKIIIDASNASVLAKDDWKIN